MREPRPALPLRAGIWPQLLTLQNGVLTLTTGRPNLAFWTSSVSKSKTDQTMPPIADGECWSYAGMPCELDVPCKGTGTSGYTGSAEVEPNVLLIAFDQLPVGEVDTTAGLQRVYSSRVNFTGHKDGTHVAAPEPLLPLPSHQRPVPEPARLAATTTTAAAAAPMMTGITVSNSWHHEVNIKIKGAGVGGCDVLVQPNSTDTHDCKCLWGTLDYTFVAFSAR
eukprot:SAG11_NODE_1289_length_5297_cov_8.821855_1_plen_222_part_00